MSVESVPNRENGERNRENEQPAGVVVKRSDYPPASHDELKRAGIILLTLLVILAVTLVAVHYYVQSLLFDPTSMH